MRPTTDGRGGPPLREIAARVYVPVLAARTAEAMLIPVLPLHLRAQGWSYTAVTVAIAAAGLGGLVGSAPVGVLLGRRSERSVLLGGLGLLAAGTLVLATTSLAAPVVGARLAAGVGMVSVTLSRQTWLQRTLPPRRRGRANSLWGGTLRLGGLAGPPVGGAVAVTAGFGAAFVLAAAVALAGVVAGARADRAGDGPGSARRDGGPGPWAVVLRDPRTFVVMGVGQLLATAVRLGREAIVPLYGAALGLDPGGVGLLVGLAAVADLTLFPVSGLLMDRRGRRWATVPAFGLMGAGLCVLPLVGSFTGLLAAATLMAVGNGLGAGTMLTLSADLAPDDAAAAFLGALGTVRAVGGVLGPVVVGAVADGFSLDVSAVVLGGAGVMAAILFGRVVGETLRT